MNIDQTRNQMAAHIVQLEARRQNGHITTYQLPPGDGGGAYEIAGINQRYHPRQAALLKQYIDTRQYDRAEKEAADYIRAYTDPARQWLPAIAPRSESYLRDTYFNAGPGGAAKILQQAVGATPDAIIGPRTKAALIRILQEESDDHLLNKLHNARWTYMQAKARNKTKAQFWPGWQNRMTKAHTYAQTL